MQILLLDIGFYRSQALKTKLRTEGHTVVSVSETKASSLAEKSSNCDLMLICGGHISNRFYEAVMHLRSLSAAPLVALVQNTSPSAMARLLNAGVDDAIKDTIDDEEFFLRLKKLEERGKSVLFNNKYLKKGTIEVDLTKKEVTINRNRVLLTKTEYKIFLYLLFHAQELVPKKELEFHSLSKSSKKSHTLNMHISRLRKKIEPKTTIRTVSAAGFMLEVQER